MIGSRSVSGGGPGWRAPHRAIIQASDEVDADLGSTGMTSLERAVIGSESESLMRISKLPVLIVHEA